VFRFLANQTLRDSFGVISKMLVPIYISHN